MSDITMVFGFLLILGAGLTGLLATWWLLFPGLVSRARSRVEYTPGRTFAMGLVGIGMWAAPIVLLLSLPAGPARFLGAAGIAVALTFATFGAAGIAALMGERLTRMSPAGVAPASSYLRGAVALVLAAGIPVLGWLVFVPLVLVESMGAAIFAFLHWVPRTMQSDAALTRAQTSQA